MAKIKKNPVGKAVVYLILIIWSLTTIYPILWVVQNSFKAKDNRSEEENRLKELEKENKQLRMENDILKQAALIMGRK